MPLLVRPQASPESKSQVPQFFSSEPSEQSAEKSQTCEDLIQLESEQANPSAPHGRGVVDGVVPGGRVTESTKMNVIHTNLSDYNTVYQLSRVLQRRAL